MIGYNRILEKFKKTIRICSHKFIIIYGQELSGKKLFVTELAKQHEITCIVCGSKIDDVREVILEAYKQSDLIIYLLPDIDKMSIGAKNALLKVTEEPPQQALFIATAINETFVPDTLKSRAQQFVMPEYTESELSEYVEDCNYVISLENKQFLINTAKTMNDIERFADIDLVEFKNFLEKLLNKVELAAKSNVYMIRKKIKFKEEETGWPYDLFIRGLITVIVANNRKRAPLRYKLLDLCSTTLVSLSMQSVSKPIIFDSFLVKFRDICKEG